MKNLALPAAIIVALASPSISFASDMFPNLTFPSDWKTTTAGQELVKAPIIIKTTTPGE